MQTKVIKLIGWGLSLTVELLCYSQKYHILKLPDLLKLEAAKVPNNFIQKPNNYRNISVLQKTSKVAHKRNRWSPNYEDVSPRNFRL